MIHLSETSVFLARALTFIASRVITVRIGGRVSPIFRRVKTDKVKKNFSGMEHKPRRISSKTLKKRLVAGGNDTDIVCVIPC
jgi:hypothetical protein